VESPFTVDLIEEARQVRRHVVESPVVVEIDLLSLHRLMKLSAWALS